MSAELLETWVPRQYLVGHVWKERERENRRYPGPAYPRLGSTIGCQCPNLVADAFAGFVPSERVRVAHDVVKEGDLEPLHQKLNNLQHSYCRLRDCVLNAEREIEAACHNHALPSWEYWSRARDEAQSKLSKVLTPYWVLNVPDRALRARLQQEQALLWINQAKQLRFSRDLHQATDVRPAPEKPRVRFTPSSPPVQVVRERERKVPRLQEPRREEREAPKGLLPSLFLLFSTSHF